MKSSTRKLLRLCAVAWAILLTYPALLFSTSAIDVSAEESSQIITTSLQQIMEENVGETTRVAIWLKDYDTPEAIATESMPDYETRLSILAELEKDSTAPDEAIHSIRLKRTALKSCYEPYTAYFGADFLTEDEIIYCSTYMPIIIAELSNERIEEIAELALVESVDYYCDDIVKEEKNESEIQTTGTDSATSTTSNLYYSVEDNIQYINAETLRNSMTKYNYINVGILDEGNPNYSLDIFSDISVEVHYSTAKTYNHPTNVLEIFSTVAPYADFYCTTYTDTNTSTTPTYISEIEWLLSFEVSVINISLTIAGIDETGDMAAIDGNNSYGAAALYLDKIAYIYDVLIVKSAGNNASSGISSGGMAYNVITVGNFDRGINSMADSSSYYSGSTYTNKPDISAPGFFTFLNGSGYDRGTSFAAPLVAGVATLLMATNTALKGNPALVKAILTASTNSSHQYTADDVEYTFYGAGVIDAENARIAATSKNYKTSICATTVGNYIEYTITATAGTVTRISMVYERAVTASLTFPLGDLNLRVADSSGNYLDSALSTVDNVEIVEFTAPSTGTYTIKVITQTIPTIGTSKSYPSFAVAWSQGGN